MISEKMTGLGKKSSVIREIFEYSNKRKAQIGAEKVFDFSLGNPSIPAPKVVNDTIKELASEMDPVLLHGYTSAPGDMNTRTVIAEHITERFGIKANPTDIYMTCGAAASLTITLKALCCDGDEIILPTPCFPEYKVFVENANAVPVTVPCSEGDLQIDAKKIADAITEKTKAIIINSPNNPTGAVFSRENLLKLAEVLKEKSEQFGNPVYIIADEPYRELVYGDIEVPYIPCLYENTIVCYSYSKSLSLPGERIGYIYVPSCCDNAGDIFAAVCGAGRSMGYVCAPSLLQRVVAKCDGLEPELDAYKKNRELLYGSLSEIGYTAIKPDGAFYLFVKALEEDANAFCERAKKYELLLVPSDDFGCKGYVRIAYCVSYEQIENSLDAFKKLYDEYK